jgi:hypothetical protein
MKSGQLACQEPDSQSNGCQNVKGYMLAHKVGGEVGMSPL